MPTRVLSVVLRWSGVGAEFGVAPRPPPRTIGRESRRCARSEWVPEGLPSAGTACFWRGRIVRAGVCGERRGVCSGSLYSGLCE